MKGDGNVGCKYDSSMACDSCDINSHRADYDGTYDDLVCGRRTRGGFDFHTEDTVGVADFDILNRFRAPSVFYKTGCCQIF